MSNPYCCRLKLNDNLKIELNIARCLKLNNRPDALTRTDNAMGYTLPSATGNYDAMGSTVVSKGEGKEEDYYICMYIIG